MIAPATPETFVVCGLKRHWRLVSRQPHASLLGVGGRVSEAATCTDGLGQVGNDETPLAVALGGAVTAVYWVLRLLKSVLGVTVLLSALIVTIPNSPAALIAGK